MSRFRLSLRSWSVALLAAAAPGAAHAQPACVTGSLRSYFALASQGCTIVGADGIGALFSNFTLDPLTSPDVPRADIVTITPRLVTSPDGRVTAFLDYALNGQLDIPPLAPIPPRPDPSDVAQGRTSLPVNATVTPLNALLIGGWATNFAPVFNIGPEPFSGGIASVSVVSDKFVGVPGFVAYCSFSGLCQDAPVGFAPIAGPIPYQGGFLNQVAGAGSSLQVAGASVGFILAPPSLVIPEPATFALVGAGLLAVGTARRRRARTSR